MLAPLRAIVALCLLCCATISLSACAPLAVRACFEDADCADNGAEIYCLKGKCNENQCEKGTVTTCFDGPGTALGKGICRGGHKICLDTGRWSSCMAQVLAQEEICDRLDNDCDGEVDETIDCSCQRGASQKCYSGAKGTLGKGPCKAGVQHCAPDNKWGTCLAQVVPTDEVCDGIDNNCDGKIDDGVRCDCKAGASRPCYEGPPGTLGKGEVDVRLCRAGTQTCSDKNIWGPCLEQVLPTKELCDEKDNDCNGKIDDAFPQKGTGCIANEAKGPCRNGTYACQSGKLICQPAAPASKTEKCGNQIDDNCDGQVDEGEACGCIPGTSQACFNGAAGCQPDGKGMFACKGICRPGLQNCQSDRKWGKCTGVIAAQTETCDGVDNNCDGQVDENFPTKGDTCFVGKGVCNTKGKLICDAQKGLVCDAKPPPPRTEACDGGDNDCDGQVDEDLEKPCYTGPAGTKGKGGCIEGKNTCINGKWSICAGERLPQGETCDGKDEDCDGKIDNGLKRPCYTGKPKDLGVGVCKQGEELCTQGKWGFCLGEVLPSPEACNGLDDDCNGKIDDKNPVRGPCKTGQLGVCTGGTNKCINGKVVCVPNNTPGPETCDDKDNDCDGSIDEGCTCKACAVHTDCQLGGQQGACSNNRCFYRCSSSSPFCPRPFACAISGPRTGYCINPSPRGAPIWTCSNYNKIGDSCTSDVDCGIGQGGACNNGKCTLKCQNNSQCPTDLPSCDGGKCEQ